MAGKGPLRVGLYVDVVNLAMNGGFGMRYDVLRQFACRGGNSPIRLNAYLSYDAERGRSDAEYQSKQRRFHAAVRDIGYKIIQKETRWYTDDEGNRVGKGNVDLDLAVDVLLQSQALDLVVLATGDGDFVQVVRALQNRGCRVEVVAFENVSGELRREADCYVSGFLIPNLLPFGRDLENVGPWGQIDGWARGVCYAYDESRGYGWIRYLKTVEGDLWRTDTRDPASPYSSIFFHSSNLPEDLNSSRLTERQVVLEFRIAQGHDSDKPQALDIRAINTLT